MQPGGGGSSSSRSSGSGSSDGSSSSGSSSGSTSGDGSRGGVVAAGYPSGAPSLLGSPYIAAHGSSSLVVGATQRHGLAPEEAFAQLSAPVVSDAAEAAAAEAVLLPAACQLWPPLEGWRVEAVRAGVRALPLRGADGSVPYAGRVLSDSCTSGGASSGDGGGDGEPAAAHGSAGAAGMPSCWVVGGLGARGLVYHAWLGRLVAAAVLAGSEAALPPELLRWREGGKSPEL